MSSKPEVGSHTRQRGGNEGVIQGHFMNRSAAMTIQSWNTSLLRPPWNGPLQEQQVDRVPSVGGGSHR
jgi:hypothetical protein